MQLLHPAAGDFQVSIDGGSFNNLSSLPAVTPAGSEAVILILSAGEMNGDVIAVRGKDQTNPKEWCDFFLGMPTTQ